jgi:hypothetical protein
MFGGVAAMGELLRSARRLKRVARVLMEVVSADRKKGAEKVCILFGFIFCPHLTVSLLG